MRRTHEYAAVQERLDPAMREAESMADVLATAANEWPDRPYLTFAPTGETLTVGELDARAERVAGALAGLGVGRGDRVGLYLTNSPTYVVGIFACAKLGAVQVPVNWQYREREVRHAVDTAGLAAVVVAPDPEYIAILDGVAPDFPGLEHVVLAGEAPEDFEGVGEAETHLLADLSESEVPDVSLDGDDPFAIMYTSGTTGLPKPALLTHRSYLLGGKSFLGAPFPEDDANYNPFPLFHGNNQFYSMTGPLLAGTEWVLAERFTTSAFWDHVIDNGVTSLNVLGGTPKMLDAAFDEDDVPDTGLELALGPIGTELWESFEATFGLRVVQVYSQTESPTLLMNHPDPEQVRVGAIGMPMFPDLGHEVTLIDADGTPVESGEEGELTRTDPGAMAGYYEMPEKTAETLRDGRIYSGDVARMDEDGYCYYVDRKKFMIRRSGENVAPREIEDVVDELPGVEESAAIPVPDEVRGEEIKVLVKRVGEVTEADVVDRVAAHLAAYKVPRYVEFVDAFPRTPSERIQRTKLAEAERERADHGWDRGA